MAGIRKKGESRGNWKPPSITTEEIKLEYTKHSSFTVIAGQSLVCPLCGEYGSPTPYQPNRKDARMRLECPNEPYTWYIVIKPPK